MSETEKPKGIRCEICSKEVHHIKKHLAEDHADDAVCDSIEDYQTMFPEAPLMSDFLKQKIKERTDRAAVTQTNMQTGSNVVAIDSSSTKHSVPIAKAFNVKSEKLFTTVSKSMGKKDPIKIDILPDNEFKDMVPQIHDEHIWDIDLLKNILLGIELNMPTLLWGHAGTGKTESFEQLCARTNRPFVRVQHTINTEESHILGQWTVKDGETIFELGPLPLAMKHGWTYLADEYDFAFPSILSVYQPVMEGKALLIKEADAANRIIEPHPDFRFCATGNTNGTGDESGLYSGTNIQNAANYSRFGVTHKAEYLPKQQEQLILVKKGIVNKDDAKLLVDFATDLRNAFERKEMGATIGPRELINAAKIGSRFADMRHGLHTAFMNRLSLVDFEKADQIAQRHFG